MIRTFRSNQGADQSQIVDEALRGWYASVLREALIRQHAAPKSPEELAEREAWKRIRTAQLTYREDYDNRRPKA